jgi:hypothetical protein
MTSCLGVTTIAGGYSETPGRADGPAQNASFSDEFEISFAPKICALLISDYGNQLVRQIGLKAEDCASGSKVGELLKIITCYVFNILCDFEVPKEQSQFMRLYCSFTLPLYQCIAFPFFKHS